MAHSANSCAAAGTSAGLVLPPGPGPCARLRQSRPGAPPRGAGWSRGHHLRVRMMTASSEGGETMAASTAARNGNGPKLNRSDVRPIADTPTRESAALRLVRLSAATDRGMATPKQLKTVLSACVAELEASAPSAETMASQLNGDWALIWSTVKAPERASSPLFWSVETFTDKLVQQGTADLIFGFTDALKGLVGLSYGSIVQSIDLGGAGQLVSKVELTVSPLPGVALNGVVTSTATATPAAAGDPLTLALKVTDTKVVGSPIPGIDQIAFPVEAAFTQLEQLHNSFRGDNAADTATVVLRTTYVDENLRVGRVGDEVFVYVRC